MPASRPDRENIRAAAGGINDAQLSGLLAALHRHWTDTPALRCFFYVSGQDRAFFRSLAAEYPALRLHGSGRPPHEGFWLRLLFFVPALCGLIEIPRPFAFEAFDKLFWQCAPDAVTLLLMPEGAEADALADNWQTAFAAGFAENPPAGGVFCTVFADTVPPDDHRAEIFSRAAAFVPTIPPQP